MSEKQYPYVAEETKCAYDVNNNTGVKALMYDFIGGRVPATLKAMKAAVKARPISVYVNAIASVAVLYKGGIMDSPECTPSTDHAVGVVGYGKEKGVGFWILRNSWGTHWGEKGYMRVKMVDDGSPGVCGIQ